MLVEDTLRTCAEYLTVAQKEEMAEHRAQTFHSLVLRGKLRTTVRWITEIETGRVLQPGDRCTKTGDRSPGWRTPPVSISVIHFTAVRSFPRSTRL